MGIKIYTTTACPKIYNLLYFEIKISEVGIIMMPPKSTKLKGNIASFFDSRNKLVCVAFQIEGRIYR